MACTPYLLLMALLLEHIAPGAVGDVAQEVGGVVHLGDLGVDGGEGLSGERVIRSTRQRGPVHAALYGLYRIVHMGLPVGSEDGRAIWRTLPRQDAQLQAVYGYSVVG